METKEALQHFCKEYPNLKDSTLHNYTKAYQDKLLISGQAKRFCKISLQPDTMFISN